jgi:hypothetical protein
MTLAFETECLLVFAPTVAQWTTSESSTLYIAFLRSSGAPEMGHAFVSDRRDRAPQLSL